MENYDRLPDLPEPEVVNETFKGNIDFYFGSLLAIFVIILLMS